MGVCLVAPGEKGPLPLVLEPAHEGAAGVLPTPGRGTCCPGGAWSASYVFCMPSTATASMNSEKPSYMSLTKYLNISYADAHNHTPMQAAAELGLDDICEQMLSYKLAQDEKLLRQIDVE